MSTPLFDLLRRVPGLQQLILLIGLAAAIAGGIGGYMWLRGPDYTTLFAGLTDADAAQVTQALDQAGILYRVGQSGDVQVPQSQLVNARMRLAAQGLPASRSGGMDSLDKNSDFGVSQFMENARYNHALENDLAATVAKLRGVSRARVHLALPKASAFIGDQGQASASVLVELYAGERLDPAQVSAIVHLVASSVPNLDPSRVTVIDQGGQLLSDSGSNSPLGRTAQQMQLTQDFEHNIDHKVTALLAPIIGDGRVRVQAHADMDYSVAEEASETYHPDPKAIRSESVSQHSGDGLLAQGVPGAVSNQPAPPVTAAATSTAKTAAPGAKPTTAAATSPPESRSESRQYAIDRSIKHVAETQGRLKRLTVAVLIDDVSRVGADGKSTPVALTTEQLQRIEGLVKSAVGFDASRGDAVSIVNTPFVDTAPPLLPPIKAPVWWKQPWVFDMGRNALAILALLAVGFGVIRPALRTLLQGTSAAALTATPQAAIGNAGTGAPGGALGAPSFNYEDKLQSARNAVAQDPRRVAQVVRNWVGTDA